MTRPLRWKRHRLLVSTPGSAELTSAKTNPLEDDLAARRPARVRIAAKRQKLDAFAFPRAASHLVLVSRYLDRGDEYIAAPRDIDNEPIPITSVTQRAAQCRNMDGQVGRLDKYVRPNPSHQFLLTDHLTWMLKQNNQDFQSTTSEAHRPCGLPARDGFSPGLDGGYNDMGA